MKGGSNLPGIQKALDEGHLKRPSGQQIQIRLQDQVKEKRLWPTPTTDSATNRTKKYKQGGTPLTVAVQQWPTPTANEDAAGKPTGKMQKMLGNHPDVRGTGGGVLSPMWVEWLMGYPSGWTDLKVSETAWFPPSPITSDSVSSNRIFWRTPTAEGDGGQRGLGKMTSEEARKKNRTVSLSRQVRDSLMWPTPMKGDAHLSSTEEVAKKRIKEGKITLSRAVQSKMWPTPTATDGRRGEIHEDGTVKKSWKKRRDKWAAKGVNLHRPLDIVVALEEEKKIWRTPTAMDGGDNAEKYAARILKGKNKRSSKHKVQETLSMQVAAENLKNNPERVDELLQEEMTTRPDLPLQKDFVEFMYSQTTPKKLSEQSGIDYTTVEHWFRKGKYFSYPSIKDWNHIKQFLQEIKYDKEMNTIKTIEWEND